MGCGRDHFHLTAHSSYSSGERANPDVAPATLLNILWDSGYEGESAIHTALVGNSMVDAQSRAQFNISVLVGAVFTYRNVNNRRSADQPGSMPFYAATPFLVSDRLSRTHQLVGLPGLFLRAI